MKHGKGLDMDNAVIRMGTSSVIPIATVGVKNILDKPSVWQHCFLEYLK